MKTYKLFFIALSFVSVLSACEKDDAPHVKSTAEKISSDAGKKWSVASVKAKYTINGQERQDDIKSIYFDDECEQDNLMVLYSNKKYETREGDEKCGSSDLVSSGTWELKKDETEIHITSNGNSSYSTIVEATETKVVTEFPETFNLTNGSKINGTVVFEYRAE